MSRVGKVPVKVLQGVKVEVKDGVVKVEGLAKDSHLIAIDKHGNESKVTKIK